MIAHIYTDGSFKKHTIGWSFVVVEGDDIIHQANGIIENPDPALLKTRNVAGELRAAMQAIGWAIENKYQKVVIHHDYTGVAYWVTGYWKARNMYTKQYVKWVSKAKIEIIFEHIKGHTGNQFNEIADQLAKDAIDQKDGE